MKAPFAVAETVEASRFTSPPNNGAAVEGGLDDFSNDPLSRLNNPLLLPSGVGCCLESTPIDAQHVNNVCCVYCMCLYTCKYVCTFYISNNRLYIMYHMNIHIYIYFFAM